jgi:small subunit ribosomal protein S16
MAVVIRLQRTGKPHQAHYRVVAIEKTRGATGKPLEVLGSYNPREESAGKKLQLKPERVEHWVKNGALPSETVASLLKAARKTPGGLAR